MSTADRVLAALQAGYKLKAEGPNKYRCNSPLRSGSNSHAFTLTIDDGEHGAFKDHVTDESGSLYQLAASLNVALPPRQERTYDPSGTISYGNLADYCQQRGWPLDAFHAAGWQDTNYQGRRAISFPVATGTRYRFIDGRAPKYKSATGGVKHCLYGLDTATEIATATGHPFVHCNGEASTIVAQHYGVAAFCVAGGEGSSIEKFIDELPTDTEYLVALDCDDAGRKSAPKQTEALRVAGRTARAVDLNGGDKFDLADFATLNQAGTAVALLALNDLSPTPEASAPKAAQRDPAPSCPPLPPEAQLDPALADGASPWLDAYIAFSRQWAAMSYDGFHEACGLWLLSTLAARRVGVPYGEMKYSSLYIALCARTSIWAKSVAANIAKSALKCVGADYLLAPDECTPQAMIRLMAGHVHADYGELLDLQQDRERNRLGFAGQRGWWYDEFGQKLSAMMREGGSMQDFRGFLRQIDVSPDSYSYTTIGRGADEIDRPYLSLLASLTPADLMPHAQKNSALWNDGFFARFAFIAPPPDAAPLDVEPTRGQYIIPAPLVMKLSHWHERLGRPTVDIEERTKNGKGTGDYTSTIIPAPLSVCTLSDAADAAYKAYFRAMRQLIIRSGNTDMDGSYARFPEKALRCAMLLASLENDGVIEIRHWARGQQIAEQWRANLHNLIDQLSNQGAMSKAAILEDKIVQKVLHLGGATINDLRRHIRGLGTEEAVRVLDMLVVVGTLAFTANSKGTKKYYVPESDVVIVDIVDTIDSRQRQNMSTIAPIEAPMPTDEANRRQNNGSSTVSTVYDVYDCTAEPSMDDSPPPADPTAEEDHRMGLRIDALLKHGKYDIARKRLDEITSPRTKDAWDRTIREAQATSGGAA